MNSTTLFDMPLGLQAPWQVEDITFGTDESQSKELHLHIGFPAGTRFLDESGVPCPVHDKVEREWQHLNFLSTIVFCIARPPA